MSPRWFAGRAVSAVVATLTLLAAAAASSGEIETDGSISPREALASAGETLRSLVGLVASLSDAPQGLELGEVSPATAASPDLELPIEELDLSERPRNCLKRARVDTIGQLVQKSEDDLLAITNFGSKSLEEVLTKSHNPEDVVGNGALTAQELADLIAYLKSL